MIDDQQLDRIHETALSVLDTVGICCDHAGMADLLRQKGCRQAAGRIFIPAHAVEAALRTLPPSFQLFGANGAVELGQGRIQFGNAGIFPNIFDFETGRIRRSTLDDVRATTRILDAMSHVSVIFSSIVDATDVAPSRLAAETFAAELQNTDKPLVGPGVTNRPEAQAIVALARAMHGGNANAAAGRPLCAPFVCPISPLFFPAEIVEAMIVIADAGLPLHIVTNPVMGLTAPYTMAGAIAMGHAEVLASIVMAQAMRPGLPMMNQNTPTIPDMASLASTSGGPENALMRHTVARLYRRIKMPVHANAQASSARMDAQAGEEKALNFLVIAQGGPSFLGGIGALANATATSYEAILLDNDRCGAIERILRGVSVDDEHLALNVMRERAAGKDFLSSEHTLAHLRSDEVWRPQFAVRSGLVGGEVPVESSVEHAHAEAARLLQTHRPSPLPQSVRDGIDAVLRELPH